MKKRRSNGEGGLSWDKERQKWCGTLRDTNGKPHKFRHVDKVEVINWLNKMRLVYSSLNPLYSYDTTLQDFAFAFIKNKDFCQNRNYFCLFLYLPYFPADIPADCPAVHL